MTMGKSRSYLKCVVVLFSASFAWSSAAAATREHRGVPTTALSLPAGGFEPVTTSDGRCSEFTLRGDGYALSVHPAKLVLDLAASPGKGPTVSIGFSGADPDAWLEPSDRQPGVTNYLSGSDPKAWRTGIPSYRRVQAHSVYPGIDLLYYSSQGQIEYDLLIAPHADPNRIRLKIEGARAIRLDANGDLAFDTAGGEIRQRRPVLYQRRNGGSAPVDGHYVLLGKNEVGFQVGSYDQAASLVIDPALTFSTYFAGAASTGYAITVDSSGYIYVTGSAANSLFIAKLDPSTSQTVYTTIIQETGAGNSIAVDGNGQAYVGGYIFTMFSYTNFPLVNPLQSTFVPHSNTGFVLKLNAAGSAPLFSTFFDGSGASIVRAITADASGNAYIAGETSSADFPVANAYRSCQSNGDGFIAKIDTSTPALTFSTCFGGSGSDAINAIARDASGNLWVTGQTGSADMPQQNSLLGPGLTTNEMRSAFIAKFDSTASNLLFSTYFGSPTDVENAPSSGNAITTDAAGNAYVTGAAPLNRNYLLSGELQGLPEVVPNGGCFVSKLSSSGTLIFSTLLSTVWPCTGVALASDGGIAVTGASAPTTYTPGLPLVDPVQSAIGNFPAGFVTVFANDGSAIRFSTYLGTTAAQNQLYGIAADAGTNLYVTGYAWGAGYPLIGQIQEYASSTQAVVSRISLASTCTYQVSPTAISVSAGDIQYRYVNVTAPAGCVWNATGQYVVGQPVVGAPEDTSDIYLSSGSDTVSLKIDFRGSADQTRDIVVAGHRVKLTLTGYGCTYSLMQTHASYSASGGFASVWVDTSPDCPYTSTSDSNWITIVFSGGGLVNYSVAANTGAARQGTITIAGLTYTVTQDAAPVPVLAAALTHIGTFYQSQTGAAYAIVVSNTGAGATTGTVTVVDTLPSGLTATAISGTGWTCDLPTLTCTRSDSLAAGAGFAPITLRVDVAANASSPLINQASISGGGSATIGASDVTTINPPPTALRFVPVTPCRIADTRNATGAFGGPRIAGGSSRSFIIPGSSCNIPATAQAYSLNVAVVPSGPLGYLTVWPSGQSQPLASTLNSLDGRIKSNAAIVPAGTSGAVSVFASDATNVVLDINGYFVLATDPTALAFYPITPCRIADTRKPLADLAGPSLAGGQSRTFPILSASACNIPASAQAYSLNFAAIPKGSLGYLTAWPTGQTMPVVSSLNAPTGTIAANAAIVPAGTAGDIDIFASNATDLVIDIDGYFAPMATGGLSLYSITPCRVLDTRKPAGSQPFSGKLDVDVAGSPCGIPLDARAHVVSATVVPSGTLGYLTLWPQGQSQPVVSTLNALDGAITSNLAIVPTTDGSISAFASNLTHLVLDIFGYFAQ